MRFETVRTIFNQNETIYTQLGASHYSNTIYHIRQIHF